MSLAVGRGETIGEGPVLMSAFGAGTLWASTVWNP